MVLILLTELVKLLMELVKLVKLLRMRIPMQLMNMQLLSECRRTRSLATPWRESMPVVDRSLLQSARLSRSICSLIWRALFERQRTI